MGLRLAQKIADGGRLMGRSLGFFARKPREAVLLARMAFWIAALSLMVRVVPLPRAMELMRPRRVRGLNPDAEATQARLAELLDALLRADFWVFTPTCWKRAPVLQRYLAHNGVATRILFGVRKAGGDLLAGHAWLERDGRPVFETQPPDDLVTYAYESSRR